VCADVLVNKEILDNRFLRTNLIPICEYARLNGIDTLTIPLLEDSSVLDKETRDTFLNNFLPLVDYYSDLKFSLEAELDPEDLLEILKHRSNLYVTYDTGNITSFGCDHSKYIDLLADYINNVHLKDRTYGGETVLIGSGDTDFELIFKKLRDTGYNGIYTLQTCREEEGKEVETLASHVEVFRNLL
jgi:sugar phosphate isomerase/epimerase